jgi:hypothetical protein
MAPASCWSSTAASSLRPVYWLRLMFSLVLHQIFATPWLRTSASRNSEYSTMKPALSRLTT